MFQVLLGVTLTRGGQFNHWGSPEVNVKKSSDRPKNRYTGVFEVSDHEYDNRFVLFCIFRVLLRDHTLPRRSFRLLGDVVAKKLKSSDRLEL